jgi:FixJ family two-component response regulator
MWHAACPCYGGHIPSYMLASSYPAKTFEKSPAHAHAPVFAETPCVWLVDDDASMLKALGRLLTSAGFKVEKFNDPVAFLATVESERCPVVILDVWMPDMNGLEVQAALSKDSPKTRIIFMSGRDDPLVRQAALDAGAFAFLAKPFDDEDLVQLIQKAIAA